MKLRFILSEVGKGLSCNRAMSVAVILVTFVSLLFVGVADLSQVQVIHMESEQYNKVEISVYICAINDGNPSCNGPEANTGQVPQVRARLKPPEMQPYVKKVYEEPKEEAYENFKRLYGNSTIGRWTSTDITRVSFRVKLVDPKQYLIVKEEFSGVVGMSEVKDRRETIEPLFEMIDAAHLLALGLGTAMIVAVILLVSTTIRLSAMSRGQETQIMRYVGVSSLFIQTLFMIGDALVAVAKALPAVASLFAFVIFLVQGWLRPTPQWTRFIDAREVWITTPLLILIATLLALVAPAVSLAEYTKV